MNFKHLFIQIIYKIDINYILFEYKMINPLLWPCSSYNWMPLGSNPIKINGKDKVNKVISLEKQANWLFTQNILLYLFLVNDIAIE